MPSISNNFLDYPLRNSAIAVVDDPNDDDKNVMKLLKATLNLADSSIMSYMDLNSQLVDSVVEKLEWVLTELDKQQEEQVFDHHAGIFTEFKKYLTDLFDYFYYLFLKFEKNLEDYMNGVNQFVDSSEADSYEHYINDSHKDMMNEMIATHLYRQGLFDVADMFVVEAGIEELTDKVTGLGLRPQFRILHDVISALKDYETELPLQWIAEYREMLGDTKASELEYKIHVNKYISIIEKSGPLMEVRMEALNYAKFQLNRFGNEHYRDEMSKVFGCLMYESMHSVADPHYLHFFDGSYKRNLIAEIEELFYIMMGQCVNDPLSTVTSVGAKCLSGVCKAAKIVKRDHGYGWAKLGELPLFLNLDEELKFHSRFACPQIKFSLANRFNPPVALLCNHVMCYKMVLFQTYSHLGIIVCPFCLFATPKDSYKTIKF